ncbi:MAG: HPF/RaiA family ribosome-associated protein [Streptosporangiaceae bacterium]
MQIQVNTDRTIEGRDELASEVSARIASRLERFGDQITRIEVHLGDESTTRKGAADMRCMIEARPAGRSPVAVTEHAASVGEAVAGATGKLVRLLESEFGRLGDKKGAATIRGSEPA